MHPGEVRVGTSGWNYAHWRGRFYPAGLPVARWFAHYASHFDTVEINNTFYRLPSPATFDAWRAQAPPRFLYAVKANRFLTHMKKLKEPAEPLARLLAHVRRLGPHLGPVLYQLPPRWKPDAARLREFCAQLPRELVHVMEFRDAAWLRDDVLAVLEAQSVSLCVHDLLEDHPRLVFGPVAYVRFHGAAAKYAGGYAESQLRPWARWLRTAAAGRCALAYFNNDIDAHAIADARTLRRLVARTGDGEPPG